jgi:hypothetical protein
MTVPVFTLEDGEKEGNVVSAIALPSRLARVPEPKDEAVKLRKLPEVVVAVKSIGIVTPEAISKAVEELKKEVGEGWELVKDAKVMIARYKAPWMRQENEVLIHVRKV